MAKYVRNAVKAAMQRSTALQGSTVTQAQGNAPRIPCCTMAKYVHDSSPIHLSLIGK
jgi:hypothetical protein